MLMFSVIVNLCIGFEFIVNRIIVVIKVVILVFRMVFSVFLQLRLIDFVGFLLDLIFLWICLNISIFVFIVILMVRMMFVISGRVSVVLISDKRLKIRFMLMINVILVKILKVLQFKSIKISIVVNVMIQVMWFVLMEFCFSFGLIVCFLRKFSFVGKVFVCKRIVRLVFLIILKLLVMILDLSGIWFWIIGVEIIFLFKMIVKGDLIFLVV